MLAWLELEIDKQNIERVALANKVGLDWKEWCIACARAGRPESLRKLYPEFADCIFSPKLRRGQKWAKPKPLQVADHAADFTRRIRALWVSHYGTKRRTRDDVSAEEFAVDICKRWFNAPRLTVEAIKRAKPSGKRKGRKIFRAKSPI
jgi:hypothetical protein